MPFRDDEEALRNRVANLEEEVREREAEHAENDALRRRVAELERAERERLAREPKPPDAAGPPRVEVAPPIRRRPPLELTSGPGRVGLFAVLSFISLQLMICGPSCVPPEADAIGWIACPSGHTGTELRQTNSQQGQQWFVLCRMPHDRITGADPFLEVAASCLYGLLPLLLGVIAHRIWRRFRGARV
jgi:hypothetical protein